MQMPRNVTLKYEELFTYINTGKLKIPHFQRDFVWSKEQTAKLLDSMLKGFPIGTFIIWKTGERLKSVKEIGNAKLPEPPKGDSVMYVLDGQQRITSLFAVRKGVLASKDGATIDFKSIWIDLDKNAEAGDEIVVEEKNGDGNYISVHDLLSQGIVYFSETFDKSLLTRIDSYKNRLVTYDFPTVELPDYSLETACEVFTRINTTGKELTLFEIMVAKTYDEENGFDLAREYDWLIKNDGSEKDLEDGHYETIPASTVLQCVSAYLIQNVRAGSILTIPKSDFISAWPQVKHGIFYTVDYLKSKMGIPVSRLLPYNALLVVLTYFFLKNGTKKPDATQQKLLSKYFWWASFSRRFSSGAEGKMAQDFKVMDDIIAGKVPDFDKENLEVKMEQLQACYFSTSDSFSKAILCLYASFHPKSFEDNGDVVLDNSWLIKANSKNYHHFFPKNYLKKKGLTEPEPNSVLNITFVEEGLNKGLIKDRAPSDYLHQFAKKNRDLDQALNSHLIGDLESFGVTNNDYVTFIRKRGQRVLREITKRLNPKL